MKKTLIIIIPIFVVIILLMIAAGAAAPKKLDWSPTYKTYDKIPLGLYVFNEESKSLFGNHEITKFSSSAYEYLDADYNYEKNQYNKTGCYLKIDYTNTIDAESANELLNYANHGNTVMLSMTNFPDIITDTLHLQTNYFEKQDTVQLYVQNKKISKYEYSLATSGVYFDSIHPVKDSITILGYQKTKDTLVPNFIEAKFGQGRILLHTEPATFSNYYMLKDNNYKYVEEVASKIPVGQLIWQTGNGAGDDDRGILSYFLSKPAFRAFFWLALIALFIFIFFNARRRQRVVPILPPVPNTTIDFTKTIGNLYFQEKNHHTIIAKKIIYFLEHVRTEYLIDTFELNEVFIERMHQKTGKPVEDIERAVLLIKKHRNNFTSTEADVIAINNAIEKLRL